MGSVVFVSNAVVLIVAVLLVAIVDYASILAGET